MIWCHLRVKFLHLDRRALVMWHHRHTETEPIDKHHRVREMLGRLLAEYGDEIACDRKEEFSGLDCQSKRSEEHTSELQSLMRISYAVFCLKKKNAKIHTKSRARQTQVRWQE